MRKLILLAILLIGTAGIANAQISKGHVMMGGNLANVSLDFGNKSSLNITPKAAWFIQDGLAVGAYANLGMDHTNGANGSTYSYGFGPMARYFADVKNLKEVSILKKTKFFVEGNLGFQGMNNSANKSHTNGLGFGFGPGVSYFITPSVGLEALLKYDGIVGFGSETYTSGLNFGIGFQIYLPSKKLIKEIKSL